MVATMFLSADGKPISAEEFLRNMFGDLPAFYNSEAQLREIWSSPMTRKKFLEQIAALGCDKERLGILQKMVDAQDSDLFDVLAYVSFAIPPISREERAIEAKDSIFSGLNTEQKEFLSFVLSKYVDVGVEELDEEKLPELLNLKYHAVSDAVKRLGDVRNIRLMYFDFQRKLYAGAFSSASSR